MRSRRTREVLAYGLFAAVAAAVNLGSQWCCVTAAQAAGLSQAVALWPALVIGTGSGLVIKYILDKKFIFEDASTGLKSHGQKFSLYTIMGLATTAIFWGAEFVSLRLEPSGRLIYLGGAIGLVIGYRVKYELDRRFVFALPGSATGAL